jgi:hypothetical protein
VDPDRAGPTGVEYLLLGGGAANAYGATRPTQDFDCLPERSPSNLERLAQAVRSLNGRLRVGGIIAIRDRLAAKEAASQPADPMTGDAG